ncbi:MAG: hypothetical protein MUQ65_07365, partial [Armatimonadetes bacterium]|nr:hypothetical protein [Armatimonadota bacterium]
GCWIDPSMMNPYLQWPVVLDEYTKNRDVYRCPSAQLLQKRGILNSYGQNWFTYMIDAGGSSLCYGLGPCATMYPSGWGGDVTDSLIQERCAIDGSGNATGGAFVQNIGFPDARGVSMSSVDDPVKFVVCADAGTTRMFWAATQVAYPDTCAMYCANFNPNYGCYSELGDQPECAAALHPEMVYDVQARKTYGRARHLGGSNLGFADGHAVWMNGEQILNGSADERWFLPESDRGGNNVILSNLNLCCTMNLPADFAPW